MAAPLKDQFDRELVETLAERFSRLASGFEGAAFVADLLAEFPALELKDRINLVADRLATDLPGTYPEALAVVVEVSASGIDGFAGWPLCSFVERHGVEWPDESLEAMTTLTQACSCEFAIRPFLDEHLERTRVQLRAWTEHPVDTVRRLPSEGTRPLLPWGPRVAALTEDPQIGLELLTALRHDESEDVRRSVANHLNDVAKAHPNLVVETLGAWLAEPQPVDERLARHALRTLVKQGHPGALQVLGFTTDPDVEVGKFSCSPSALELGASIELGAVLTSTADHDQMLVIDFVIHHVKASGGTSPKVFKWTSQHFSPGERVQLAKRRLIQTASTRRYHAGVHRIDLQVAGKVLASTEFHLTDSSPSS
jgi:3-methyladenine DNA glycosylase AlkC